MLVQKRLPVEENMKPHLRVLNTKRTCYIKTLVEYPEVERYFRVTKGDTMVPEVDLIYTQTYTAGDIVKAIHSSPGVPYVVHVGGDAWYELKVRNPQKLIILNKIMLGAKLIVANSSWIYQIIRKQGFHQTIFLPGGLWGFDDTPAGIDASRYQKKQTYKASDPFKIMLGMSLNVRKKYLGIEMFLRNAQPFLKDKTVEIICAGTIDDKPFAAEMSKRYGIQFIGMHDNWNERLIAGDVLLHPSMFDCFPRTLGEAKCAGMPIIAFDTEGNRTVGDGPIYVDPHSSEQMCEALELLYQNQALREYLGYLNHSDAMRKMEAYRYDYSEILRMVHAGQEKKLIDDCAKYFSLEAISRKDFRGADLKLV